MFCEKLFTFHSFPCQALPTGCAGQQRENQKHEPPSAVSLSDIGNYFFFPPR